MRTVVTDQRGMTLPEILIAVGIIGVGLAALSSAIPLAAYGVQEGKQLSTATFLANERLEEVRNAPWQAATAASAAVDKLGVSASSSDAPASGGVTTFADEDPVAAYTGYSRTVRITDCGTAPGCGGTTYANLRQVTVTVSYVPMTGIGVAPSTSPKSAIVTMYIAQR